MEEYDQDDPFVDDSELAWEAQAAAVKDGFFVYCGPLVPEGEKPAVERYGFQLIENDDYTDFTLLVLMELSNGVVAVEEAVGRAQEAVVVEQQLPLLPPPMGRVAMAVVVVLDLEEAPQLANRESPKLHER